MVGGSRKLHTKSRNGCGQCKKRRVRCDCIGPRCSNCRRRGETCEFNSVSHSQHHRATSPASDQQHGEQAVGFYLGPHPAALDLEALELLHHYLTTTSLTSLLLQDAAMLRVWQLELPLAAQSHDFLMHALLALAALHKAHLCPATQSKYYLQALQHQTKGSEKFRSVVEYVSKSNSTAVFGFSVIVAMSQFKYCAGMLYSTPAQGMDTIIDVITTLRRTFQLAIQHDALFQESSFGILPARMKRLHMSSLDVNTELALEALEALEQMNLTSDTLQEEKEVSSSTIGQLRRWYRIVSAFPRTWGLVIRWPMVVSSEYLALLQARRPMALVILTYWCVPVHRVKPRWFIDGWAESVVRIIASILPEAWKQAISWPINEMNLGHIF
ncbi:uncharacterized protein LY89DRAFT_684377 [Mollisia scopiformis]|uniref:Zn(2)-C6 fungal-type domain-containing protein n=1 Tax=Mollisia scopiformis TaxID=149040 RepID=A0A194XAU6_MOLSC|nr:uncharacterized protein LY89DRAFT_684377 [Mollisia scopiformis]KUJ17296.1 hypothetical protein LY89DRAFT_684377 [Mollisia scopiformis]